MVIIHDIDLPELPSLDSNRVIPPYHPQAPDDSANIEASRLAFLGEKVIELAIANHWYDKYPSLSEDELREKAQHSLDEKRLTECLHGYKLAAKLAHAGPPQELTTEDCRLFLNAYAGAVFLHDGYDIVQNWISKLIDPSGGLIDQPEGSLSSPSFSQPVPRATPPPLSLSPSPSREREEADPPSYSPPGIETHDAYSYVTLAIFNETATKRGHTVTWSAMSSGEAHRPDWTVGCHVDNEEKGRGIASNQKVAKEQAAREAWRNMGWSLPSPTVAQHTSPVLQHQIIPFMVGGSLSSSSFVTVSLFNTTAAQRRFVVVWETQSSGSPHMPTWTADCLVNGVRKGQGVGKNTKEAKLLAAQKAWEAMGW
ncbi:hypothetical protein AMATHDRAFT_62471 [Amanita thiersii Skay4041]|uniref:DRBM domain-containing protein n=1 Tax=Amanita thiersii Skay4041 TaxID=703135 RepID=A0A2A9NQ26_9AGAR|nr:hypothetical protein AMATHDRAFT_62471 [Amanita thiersii Skay4041]